MLTRIGNSFIDEYAQRFDMPELHLRSYAWEGNTSGLDPRVASVRMTTFCHIVPRGQLSSLVRSLQVCFTIFMDEHDRCTAEVRTQYDHHSGGSNGLRVDFFLVTEKSISFHLKDPSKMDQDAFTYKSFLPYDDYLIIARQNAEIIMKPSEK